MEYEHVDPLLGELRDRVWRLEHRTTYLESVVARLIQLIGQLVKPAKEKTA